eukprot:TRINITY_DN23264_c0_g1_i1.p1 TRINITY_DN23264_c0_g1~~TRINITY_DN23264_c0_g1_i1.p1  ORF type:complete len:302 (+),score=38.31 TRINITY_DN23264_c0_g1_i1:45-950(+)
MMGHYVLFLLSLISMVRMDTHVVHSCFQYTVVSGDTCYALSQRFGVPMGDITDLSDGNKLCVNCRMWVGDLLQICSSPTPPSPPSPPPSGGGVASILSESLWNSMFPNRNASRYTYANLISASQRGLASGFCNGGDSTANRRELAMFLANAAHETGDFYYVCEACNPSNCGPCSSNYNYGGDSSHQYYGRGALQISWNYNYQAAGSALGVDLLSNPSVVAFSSDYVFSTALWFWMQNSGGACHSAAQNNQGFAVTIRTINGGIECNQSPGSIGYNEMMDRVTRYKNYAAYFNVDPGSNLTC